jgi:hypothetical protein
LIYKTAYICSMFGKGKKGKRNVRKMMGICTARAEKG